MLNQKFTGNLENLFVPSSLLIIFLLLAAISFKGRRSQEGLNLNSLDVGVFGAPKYN